MGKIKQVKASELSEIIRTYSPLVVEIRKRLLFTLFAFSFSTIAGFIFYEKIIGLLIRGLSLEGINIVFTSPFQFINLAISTGVSTGVIVTFPLLIFQIIYFLKPALQKKEYAIIMRYLPLTLILFLLGFIFGAIIMKWQIEIFLTRSLALGIGNILDISSLLTTVFLTSVLMGLGFQFPIVLLILLRVGLMETTQLTNARPWVYLGSFIFVLFLPPDSILADIVLSLPFIALFELAIVVHLFQERKVNTK